MTCIIGLLDKNKIYMAGDHIASDGYSLKLYNEQKVFLKDDFIIGCTGSFRMAQLLQYSWDIPERNNKQSNNDYLFLSVVPSIISLFEKNGFLKKEEEQKKGGVFLIGYKNRLYRFQSDFSLVEDSRGFSACGCGEDFAIGALEAIQQIHISMSPEKKIRIALSATEKHCALVALDWNRFQVFHL